MDLSRYYEQICREPLLDKEEEHDLFMELQDEGLSEKRRNEIRDRIIRSNLRFVFKTAKNYSKNDPNLFEELIGAGNEGLLVGMEKFRPARGVRFLSYAGFWILQRILKQMSKLRIVSLPIWKQQLAARIQKVNEAHENSITFEELKKEFPDVPEKDLLDLFQTRYLTFYIEDIGDDPAFEVNPIEDEVEAKLDKERLHNLIATLTPLQQEVIQLSFGLTTGTEMKYADIAKELGTTVGQVKAAKKEALEKMKWELDDHNPFA